MARAGFERVIGIGVAGNFAGHLEQAGEASDMMLGTVSIRREDLQRDRGVEDASVVILLLTLQFIRPLNREHVIRRIFEGMRDQAALILVEKIIVDEANGMVLVPALAAEVNRVEPLLRLTR